VATTHADLLTGFKLADADAGNGADKEMQRSA